MTQTKKNKDSINEAYKVFQSGDLKKALSLYLSILDAEPDNLHALNMTGFIFYMLGAYSEGLPIAKRAVALYPDNAYANKALAMHLFKNGEVEDAVTIMKKAISIDKNFIDAYHDLAYILYESGDSENALDCLKEGYKLIKSDFHKAMFDRFLSKLDAAGK